MKPIMKKVRKSTTTRAKIAPIVMTTASRHPFVVLDMGARGPLE